MLMRVSKILIERSYVLVTTVSAVNVMYCSNSAVLNRSQSCSRISEVCGNRQVRAGVMTKGGVRESKSSKENRTRLCGSSVVLQHGSTLSR